jgi:hypothetical protein
MPQSIQTKPNGRALLENREYGRYEGRHSLVKPNRRALLENREYGRHVEQVLHLDREIVIATVVDYLPIYSLCGSLSRESL